MVAGTPRATRTIFDMLIFCGIGLLSRSFPVRFIRIAIVRLSGPGFWRHIVEENNEKLKNNKESCCSYGKKQKNWVTELAGHVTS